MSSGLPWGSHFSSNFWGQNCLNQDLEKQFLLNPLKAVCLQTTATGKEQRLTQKELFMLRHTLSKARQRGWGFPSCSVDSGPLCMEERQPGIFSG